VIASSRFKFGQSSDPEGLGLDHMLAWAARSPYSETGTKGPDDRQEGLSVVAAAGSIRSAMRCATVFQTPYLKYVVSGRHRPERRRVIRWRAMPMAPRPPMKKAISKALSMCLAEGRDAAMTSAEDRPAAGWPAVIIWPTAPR